MYQEKTAQQESLESKLWHLKIVKDAPFWQDQDYEYHRGFVMRASSEVEARAFADKAAEKYENSGSYRPWLDENVTTCEPLEAEGVHGIIVADFYNA